MNPSRIENPVARTPNTPAARSPSPKKPPSGARRRTNSSAVTPTAQAPVMATKPQMMFIVQRPFAHPGDAGAVPITVVQPPSAAAIRWAARHRARRLDEVARQQLPARLRDGVIQRSHPYVLDQHRGNGGARLERVAEATQHTAVRVRAERFLAQSPPFARIETEAQERRYERALP